MNTKGLSEFLTKNWQVITAAVVAVLLVIGGFGLWNESKKANERNAAEMLYQLQKTAAGEKRSAAATDASLQPLFEKYPHSRAAYEATLQVGDLFMEEKTFPEAAKHYEKAADIAKDPFSKLLARYNLGVAEESGGQFKEAVANYDSALKSSGVDFLEPEILLAKGRCLEALKEVGKAVAVYKEIQEKYKDRSYYSGAASAFEKQLTAGSAAADGKVQ